MKYLFAFLYFFGRAAAISQGIPPQCNILTGGLPVNYGCEEFGLKDGSISRLNCTEVSPGIMPWALRPKIEGGTLLNGRNSDNTGPAPYTLTTSPTTGGPTAYKPGELMVLYLRVTDYDYKYRGLLGYARPQGAMGQSQRIGDWEQPDPEQFTSPWLPGNACQGGLTHSSARIKPYLTRLYWRAPPAGSGPVQFELLIKQGDANTGAFFYPATMLVLTEGVSTFQQAAVLAAAPGQTCDTACEAAGMSCDQNGQSALASGGLTTFQAQVQPWLACDHLFASCGNSDPLRLPVSNDCTYHDSTLCPTGQSPTSLCGASGDPTASRICACAPDPCNPSPCNPVGGVCAPDPTKYTALGVPTEDAWKCNCVPGFGGPRCNQLPPTCGRAGDAQFPCISGGTCVPAAVAGQPVTCDCTTSVTGAWTGRTCEIPPPCADDPCKTRDAGAVCQNIDIHGNRTFVAQCQCSLGFSGPRCTVIDGCAIRNANPATQCKNGGVCRDNSDDTNLLETSSCNCPPGFVPEGICDTDLDECGFGENPCRNNGTCENLLGSYRCNCDQTRAPSGSRFGGPTCSEDPTLTVINWCTPNNPCSHAAAGCTECVRASPAGVCNVANDILPGELSGFHCNCDFGWSGQRCTDQINFCSTNPCQNGGTCVSDPISNPRGSVTEGYSCQCAAGFEHGPLRHCEVNTNDCAVLNVNPCANGGTCIDGVNSFTCRCTQSWKGPNCLETIVNPGDVGCPNGRQDCPPSAECNGVGQFARCSVIGCPNDDSCPIGQACTGSDIPNKPDDRYCENVACDAANALGCEPGLGCVNGVCVEVEGAATLSIF